MRLLIGLDIYHATDFTGEKLVFVDQKFVIIDADYVEGVQEALNSLNNHVGKLRFPASRYLDFIREQCGDMLVVQLPRNGEHRIIRVVSMVAV